MHDVSSASSATTPAEAANPVVITLDVEAPHPGGDRRRVVGGWLKFFCFTLIVSTPLGTVFALVSEYRELSSYFGGNALVISAFALDALLGGSLALFSFYAGIQLGALKPHAVHTAKQLLVCVLAYDLLMFVFAFVADPSTGGADAAYQQLVRGMIYFLTWMQYLRKSKRVRSTYPEMDSGAAQPLLPKRWAPSITAAAILITCATVGLGAAFQNDSNQLGADVLQPSSARAPKSRSREWQEYISTKDDFSVNFPGSPSSTEEQQTVRGLAVFTRTYSVTTADAVEYAVAATEIPKQLDAQSSVLIVLEGMIAEMASNAGGSIIERSMTRVEGFPAADVTITSDNGILRARLIVAESRIFILLQGVHDADEATGSYSRFRESFDISPR